MALSDATKNWFNKNGLQRLLRVVKATLHEEPEKVALQINLEEITKGMVQSLIELLAGDLYSIDNPSTKTLTEYFGKYSIASKAYRTQGEEDPLFREVAPANTQTTEEPVANTAPINNFERE